MGTRKRKVFIPPEKTAPKPQPGVREPPAGPEATSINLGALGGRSGFAVGDKVRILGTGLYAGEIAVIERMANGAIPSAAVRTEAGRARTVRTVDLEPAAQRTEQLNRPRAAAAAPATSSNVHAATRRAADGGTRRAGDARVDRRQVAARPERPWTSCCSPP